MHDTRKISEKLDWVGANDPRIVYFENMFPLDNGVTYNSYLYTDEKTCLLDTVDADVAEQFVDNVQHVLGDRKLDYLVILHMEPDHCGSIERIVLEYPEVKLVGNKKTFQFLEQFYETDLTSHYHLVEENDELALGNHTLRFIFAPFVHWPEVMMAYDTVDKVLFSADAFGDFGVQQGNLYSDQIDIHKKMDEIRRYYINIVGRHGANVQKVFDKLEGLEIKMICALHGHIYRTKEDIELMIDKYQHWSTYTPERQGVTIVYSSMYGNTELAMSIIANKLSEKGAREIQMFDVSRTDPSYIVAACHKNSHTLFGLVTYNTELYPKMDAFLRELLHTRYQNRKIGLVVNKSWGSMALKQARGILEGGKEIIEVVEPLNITSALKPDEVELVDQFVDEIIASLE